MKLDLDKFYNSNWKTFVHKEAIEQALKRVPELELKDVEIENILSLTFSVDQHGENPMYIEYLDKEGKKHLVRIRPAVTEEINEILKNYETKEEHQVDVENIYNYFTRLNVPMEVRSQNSLDDEGNKNIIMNNDNAFISFQVDPEQDDAIQWLAIQNKNGALGDQYQYMARFVDFAKVDEVPSNADFAEKLQELEEKMNTADNNVLATSKEYTDSNISSLANELNVKIEQTKNDLTILIDEKAEDTLQHAKEYADSKDTECLETSKRYTDNAKQEAVDESKAYTDSETNTTLIASKNYTDTKHSEVTQQVIELTDKVTPLTSKLSNIWGGHKATFIYWLPNIDINTIKLENAENDVKVTLNDGDVVYWRKNEYQPVDLSNYVTKTESDETYATKEELVTQVTTLCENDQQNFVTLNDRINTKTSIYTKTQGQSTELRYPRATFTKLTNGDISFNPGISSDPVYGYLLNESQLTKLKNLDDNPTGNSTTIRFNDEEDVTQIDFLPGTPDSVTVTTGTGVKMNGKFITPAEKNSIADYVSKSSELGPHKIPNRYWYYEDKTPNFERMILDGDYVRTHIENPVGCNETITYTPTFKSASASDLTDLATLHETDISNLTRTVQEIATKVGSSEIGERTPINFNLFNNDLGGTTDPNIINNDSYYVKVGNKNIVSVYLTFKVDVTPTSSQKMVTCGMEQDIPGYDHPYLTLTSMVKGKNTRYTNTIRIPTNQNFLQFYLPSIPGTDTYNDMEITIYGSAITKDLSN